MFSQNVNENEYTSFIEGLSFAFQPIVDLQSGCCYGVEALLRGVEAKGYSTIASFFDDLHDQDVLFCVDLLLRNRALSLFTTIPFHQRLRLFYNLDNRIMIDTAYREGATWDLLDRHSLSGRHICFEVSERHSFQQMSANALEITRKYREEGFGVAIDDFGTGFSGLQLLYQLETDLIKIDRFFAQDISSCRRKRTFVEMVVQLCHRLGMKVVIEGVEKEEDFFFCRELGIDMIQGYLIQRPTMDVREIEFTPSSFKAILNRDRRARLSRHDQLPRHQITKTPFVTTRLRNINELLDIFKHPPHYTIVPVLDDSGIPLGILCEKDLKRFFYSNYGTKVLENIISKGQWLRYLREIPIMPLDSSLELLLRSFRLNPSAEGIIIVENECYQGILFANALLEHLYETNLAMARDQNPLTMLPGNRTINIQVSDMLASNAEKIHLVYFDFNQFKPFNDLYGFRQGDRAIQIFADILLEWSKEEMLFVGHIGGDDFVLSTSNLDSERMLSIIRDIVTDFNQKALALHDEAHRLTGYCEGENRQGDLTRIGLLTVSALLLILPGGDRFTFDEAAFCTAKGKKLAKKSPDYIHIIDKTRSETTPDLNLPLFQKLQNCQ